VNQGRRKQRVSLENAVITERGRQTKYKGKEEENIQASVRKTDLTL
jgi:hypothetical protein